MSSRSESLLIKLGGEGFITYQKVNKNSELIRQPFPALTINPVDVTGAGDALFSIMALALTSGMSLLEASALGTCASALAVRSVGNVPFKLGSLENFIRDHGL